MNSSDFEKSVSQLLAQIGQDGPFKMQALDGGANNQVFKVTCGSGQFCLKRYFQHEKDPRNRYKTEYSFISFAWQHGIRAIPRPVACNDSEKIALYDFIPGKRFKPGEIHQPELDQALAFYKALNQHRNQPTARELPRASEYCESINDHIQRIEFRRQRLNSIGEKSTIDGEAVQFIQTNLKQAWQNVKQYVRAQAKNWQINISKKITTEDSCLSPSDFGFHNALKTTEGLIYFIDFEYAGWDDPDRMVADFFCQPAVPVPLEFFSFFTESIASGYANPELHLKRMKLLLPIYQIKWCCILLNDFLPTDSARRQFSKGNENQNEKKRLQLEKARQAVQRIESMKMV